MADYQKAEELRKAKNFAEAEPMFAELWQQTHRMAGWRYAFCLRKQGKFDEALDVAYEVVEQLPEDIWSRGELIRAIYDVKIKPAKENNDLWAIQEAAEESLILGAEGLSLKLIVFAVVDVAKAHGKWDIVAEWCDRLDPMMLSDETTIYEDHQIMPYRERWYFARIKAAQELKQWETCRTLGMDAKQTFPRRKDFGRWAAKALAEQGQGEAAIAELRTLLWQGRPEWYLHYDLATLERRFGDPDAALRHACEAALAPGEDKAKVQLYAFIAQLWLERGILLPAAQAAALAHRVREREGWASRTSLQQLEEKIQRAFREAGQPLPEIPDEPRQIVRTLREGWHQGVETGITLHYGMITRLPLEKDFGFIRRDDGHGDVYFKRREAPNSCLKEGQRVGFILEPAFDTKKQQETVRAVKIRPS